MSYLQTHIGPDRAPIRDRDEHFILERPGLKFKLWVNGGAKKYCFMGSMFVTTQRLILVPENDKDAPCTIPHLFSQEE